MTVFEVLMGWLEFSGWIGLSVFFRSLGYSALYIV